MTLVIDLPVRQTVATWMGDRMPADLSKFFRSGGYLPTWLLAGAALVLCDRQVIGRWGKDVLARGMMVIGAPMIAGLLTELLKLICRRERFSISQEWYHFRPIWERPLSTGGLSMPSSHVALAFAGAFVLCRLLPAARPVWIAFAVGTAIERIVSGAHFLSDVYAGAWVGYAGACITAVLIEQVSPAQRRNTSLPHLEMT